MAKVIIHAGDWAKGSDHSYFVGSFMLRKPGAWSHESVSADRLTTLEVASEENVKRIGGMAGWGVAGAVMLGPVGLLAGLLIGGNKKDVTFIAQFDDGRKILATTDSKAFTKMQAAIFDRKPSLSVTESTTEYYVRGVEDASLDGEDEIRAKILAISHLRLSPIIMEEYERKLRYNPGDAERFIQEALNPSRR